MTDKNNQHKNPIKENLQEQFEQLESKVEAPVDLKKEVFSTLDSFNLLGDILDLFTAKFGETEVKLMNMVSDSDENGTEKEAPKTDK